MKNRYAEANPTVAPARRGEAGLLVAQWYLDTFYEDVESLPAPDTPAFTEAVAELEKAVEGLVGGALDGIRPRLAELGVTFEVVER